MGQQIFDALRTQCGTRPVEDHKLGSGQKNTQSGKQLLLPQRQEAVPVVLGVESHSPRQYEVQVPIYHQVSELLIRKCCIHSGGHEGFTQGAWGEIGTLREELNCVGTR